MEVKENKLFWAKVSNTAVVPTKDNENAGYDLYADVTEDIIIAPHETTLIPTGIACAMSDDYYLQIEERGSTGSKGIKRSAGVVDSSYRGAIFVAITNTNSLPVVITNNIEKWDSDLYIVYPSNKAIAQAIIHQVPKMDVEEISYEELKAIPSKRGTGALGSSGK